MFHFILEQWLLWSLRIRSFGVNEFRWSKSRPYSQPFYCLALCLRYVSDGYFPWVGYCFSTALIYSWLHEFHTLYLACSSDRKFTAYIKTITSLYSTKKRYELFFTLILLNWLQVLVVLKEANITLSDYKLSELKDKNKIWDWLN